MFTSEGAEDALLKLQIAHSVKDVAIALNLDPEKFFYVVQNSDEDTYYKKFQVPKKKGGFRLISQPVRGLALSQDRLAELLVHKYQPKNYVKGYVKGQSFLTNAQTHEKQKWVLNFDVENFFPSIGFGRIRGLFLSKLFGFNHRVATVLARITTHRNELPQGASTSPVLANIIAHNLDKKLFDLALRNKLKYSRYADDITFSSSSRKIPPEIVRSWEPNFGDRLIELGRPILDAFSASGFKINPDKTRIQFPYERQEVTGLVVNRSANVRRQDISRLRMKLFSARKFGAAEAAKIWVGKDGLEKEFWAHIAGWISYIRQVRGEDDPVVAKLCKLAVTSGLSGVEWIERYADMVREFDVFLSHASEDKPIIRPLKEKLEQLGVKVFFDEDSIQWGDSIAERINRGLLMSRFFLPFLTTTFSKKGWTNKELNSALQLNIGRKNRILPLLGADFSIEDNYPLLSDNLYKKWPADSDDHKGFIDATADEVLRMVEKDRMAVN